MDSKEAIMEALARRRQTGLSQHPVMQIAMPPPEAVDKNQVNADTNMSSRRENEHDGEESPSGSPNALPHNEMQMTASQLGLVHHEMGKSPYAKHSLRGRAVAEAQEKSKQTK